MSSGELLDLPGGPVEVVHTDGDATLPPLLFLHEGLGSARQWRDVPSRVAAACGDPPTIAYSRHGYGASAAVTLPRPVTYMHHEADVVLPALRDALGLPAPVLIGHSDGASIALLHAAAGYQVVGVAALAPHVFVEDVSVDAITAAREAYATTDLRGRLARHHADVDTAFRGWNDVWLDPDFRSWDITERLPAITAPLLVIQGDGDPYGTFAQLDAIERGVGGPVERVELGGVGHAPQRDDPETTIAAIARFVRRLTA